MPQQSSRGNQQRSGGNQQRSGGNQQRSGNNQQRSGGNQERSGGNQQRSGGNQQRSGVNQQRSGNNSGGNNRNNKQGGSGQDFLNSWLDQTKKKGGIRNITSPTMTPTLEALYALWQQNYAETYAANRETTELALADGDNQTRLSLGEMNLQGVLGQAEATKFAASEGARGQIESSRLMAQAQMETQRIASASQERQIGLTGLETRKTNEQSEMFRRYKEAKDQSDALRAFRA